VSALWSEQGNPYGVVEKLFKNELVLCYSTDILDEYKEVLNREKFGFSKVRVKDFLDELEKCGAFTKSNTSTVPFNDETDRKFYDMAISNDAVLITGNLKHYPDHPSVKNPDGFLRSLE
jgi:putative PIN family toxin of toxin-antitoxin system